MDIPIAVRSVVAAGAACAVLQLPNTQMWSGRFRALVLVLAAYLPSYLSGAEYRAAPLRSPGFRKCWQAFARFFWPVFFDIRESVIEEPEKLKAHKQKILAVHPHGVLSLDHIMTIAGFDQGLEKVAPQSTRSALSANILFKLPFVREIGLSLGAVDASRNTTKKCLKAGLSLSVVPGGEREQLIAQRGPVETCVLRKRFGFVRLALMFGVPLVPVYCFGEAQLYYHSQFLFGFRSWVQRTLGVALVMPYGPWGIPWLPFRAPVRLVVGAPIEVPKIEEPTEQQIEEHHRRYMEALECLFEKHKSTAGYEHVSLKLI